MSDSESLPSDVDVIVYGTGLPESIIAGACARSGMTVLHLDRNSYYGGIWASFNLHTINEWTDFPFEGISCENGIGSSAVLIRDDEDYISLIHRNPFEHCSVKWHIEDSHEESPEGQVFTGRQSSESTVAQTTEEQGSSSSDASIESASEIAAQVDQRNNTHFANAQNASSSDRADDSGRYTRSNMEENWRRFNIDLLPKVLLSRGPLVQTLCDSEVAKYCEFKCVDRFLCIAEESEEDGSCFHYHVVPSSRAEIFQSETISMLEKRRVMKFLKLCIDWKTDREKAERELRGHDGQTFNQLLDSYEITGNVKNYIVETLAVLRNGVTVQEGIDAVSQFLESVGRFGNSPFLWTLYGSGELPQCFCRLCAVFGGVYCLNRSINGLIVHDNRVTAVVVDNQRINCKNIVLDSAFLPPYLIKSADAPYNSLNRAVLITDRSLLHDPAKEHITLLNLSRLNHSLPAHLLEVGYEACAAPKGYYICHITAVGSGDPSSVLSPIIHQLFRSEGPLYRNGDSRPRILWSVVFSINQQAASEDLPLNVAVFPTIDSSVEYSSVIHSVREAFGRFWPDVDFLPRRLENVDDEECAENDESITEQRDENSLVDGGDSRSNYRSAMLRSEPVMLGDGGQLSSNMEVDGDRTNQRLSQDAPINS